MDEQVRTRMSVRELERPENAAKLNAFLRAWRTITSLPPGEPNSFWTVAKYYGEPFKPRQVPVPDGTNTWPGWSQHDNVLFPTWNRFFVFRLEQALREVSPGEDVSMVYWDETSEETLAHGIPKLLTDDMVMIDGQQVPNPLKHYTLQITLQGPDPNKLYNKPQGYTTVRYPFAGNVSPPRAKQASDAHNERMKNLYPATPSGDGNTETAVDILNYNITHWLKQEDPNVYHPVNPNSLFEKYKRCLQTPDFNSFSNTNSAAHTNQMSLETPSNAIHLAVGGFTTGGSDSIHFLQSRGSSGDMGEMETAAFDPIFFFHACNVDRIFWIWQKIHDKTDSLEIDTSDRWGTNPLDVRGQGPSPDQKEGDLLSMDTILPGFAERSTHRQLSSRDCINIEEQLGYVYSPGSFEWGASTKTAAPYLKVKNIQKDAFSGSIAVRGYYKTGNDREVIFIGQHPVLSRWSITDCENPQSHLLADAFFDLSNVPQEILNRVSPADYVIEIVSRDPMRGKTRIDEIVIGTDAQQEGVHQVEFITM